MKKTVDLRNVITIILAADVESVKYFQPTQDFLTLLSAWKHCSVLAVVLINSN